MYSYLAEGVGHRDSGGAFRSLKQGFKHWASGRLSYLELNVCHPLFCHVRSKMTPSMKQGIYTVYILLGSESGLATIKAASCECAAGYVCVHNVRVFCVCVVCVHAYSWTLSFVCTCMLILSLFFFICFSPLYSPLSPSLTLTLSLSHTHTHTHTHTTGNQRLARTYLVSFTLLLI